MATETTTEAAKPAKATTKKKPARKNSGRPRAKVKAAKAAAPKKRKFSTPAERAKILAAADREGLTALQVQKRFGVKPVTYYSWRKKAGLKGPRGRKPASAPAAGRRMPGAGLEGQVRAGVQARVREILPQVVREEVAQYLDRVLGKK